ncbi:MAG: helix-turn-helix transcriptional regulator, partial [Clostridiales bacterium]|nr:helix-turn-helix transcriptional regulator [Clostridiales bacterium]
MEDWDKINAVDRMQKYIASHIESEITLQDLSRAAGYSPWYALRLFKELTDKTPFEYIRAMRLTAAAKELRDSDAKVVDGALDGGFDSHDGFTRAFAKRFYMTPQVYRREKPPVHYFVPYPVRDYYLYTEKSDGEEMK